MALSLMAVIVTSTAFAKDARLRRLGSGVESRTWESVGRLNVDGKGFCTGALIAPRLVLTAAHCLYDHETYERIDAGDIEFLAGWRDGRAGAYRTIRRAVVHPEFDYAEEKSSERVRNDLALLELDAPIRNSTIKPLGTAARPRKGDRVGVVSYAFDRSEAPSLQEVCTVLAQQEGVLVTSCSVDFGSSGAPIFTFQDGEAHIVSIVSAKARVEGQLVSLGTSLGTALALLQAEMVAGNGIFLGAYADATQQSVEDEDQDTGAKFVKP